MDARPGAREGGFGDLALPLVDALTALPADAPPALAAVALDRDGLGGRRRSGGRDLGHRAAHGGAGWASRPARLELSVAGAAATRTVRDGVLELATGGGRSPQR